MAASIQNRRIRPKPLKIDDISPSPPENQFLSPNLSVQSVMSPPPRPQADDYFGSRRAKKRRHNGIRRPCPTPLLQSDDTGSAEGSIGHNSEPGSSKRHNVEFAFDHIENADYLTETPRSDTPLLATIAAGGQARTGMWAEQSSHGPTVSHCPVFISSDPSNQDDSYDSYDPHDSPAVNSLRRISRSMTQSSDSKRREFKHLSKTLTDKIGTIFRSKRKSPFGDVSEYADRSDVFGFHNASNDPSTWKKNISGDLSPTSKVSNTHVAGLRNPAYITLRKASGVNSFSGEMNANNPSSIITKKNQQPAKSTANSNLVSFQSQLKHHAVKPGWQEDPKIMKRSISPALGSSFDKKPYVRTRFMSLSQLGNSAQSQPYAFPAEPALTLTSFYPTRAASLKPQSRSNSVPLERGPFRFSIVQIVSRESIHEVIWYEDETSASDTPSSPISPTNGLQERGGSVAQVVLDSGRQEPPLIAITTSPTEVSALPQGNEHALRSTLIDPTDAHKRLLSWSWDNTNPSIADFSGAPQESNEAAEVRDRTSSSSMRSKLSMRRAATADILAAGCFPHLLGQDSMPTGRDDNEESMAKTRTETKDRDTPEAFDRGLEMFQRRGISLGSVHSSRVGSQNIGEKNGVKSSGSQLRVNTK